MTNIQQTIQKNVEEFERFMIEEYGKWKIGRAEAKSFLRSSQQKVVDEIVGWAEGNEKEVQCETDARYGDTAHLHNSVVYGYNQALQDLLNFLKEK
jgi:hypothetical protein